MREREKEKVGKREGTVRMAERGKAEPKTQW